MTSLTAYERETIVNHAWGENACNVESFARPSITRIHQLAKAHPEHVHITRDVGYGENYPASIEATIPWKCIGIRPHRRSDQPDVTNTHYEDGYGYGIPDTPRDATRHEMETRLLTNDEMSWWHAITNEPQVASKILGLAHRYPKQCIARETISPGGQSNVEARIAKSCISIRPSKAVRREGSYTAV